MSNVIDTFYKGNINRFGLGGWNSVRDDFNEVSKSTQNVKLPFSNNINNGETSSIYKPQIKRYPQSSHFSPDLIRMQYFNDKIIDLETKMNNNYQANLRNAQYNVYEDQYDPLIGRRRNVQRRLEKIKNKLLNDEEQNRLMIQKKIEEENNIIDDLILENQKSPNENLNKIFNNNEDNNRDRNYNFDEVDQFLSGLLSENNSKKHSPLILSRTSSKESTDLINEKYFSNEDSEDKLSHNKSIYDEARTTQKTKRKSRTKKNNVKNKKRPKHTDIMKVLAQMDKYSVPKDSAKNELVEQSKQAGSEFYELLNGIKELKNDFKEKISKLNETTENNINDIREILMLCENQNLKNAIEHIFDNRSRKPRKEKYYLDYEMKGFKAQIEKTIDEALDNYYKRKVKEAYDLNLKNEPIYNEKDYNLRIKENERSKYGLIHVTNLYNQIQRNPEVRIKSNLLDAESAYSFSSSDTIKSNIFTFSNNSRNNFFPALRGLKEVNTCVISENEEKIEKNDKNDKNEKNEKKSEKNGQKNKKKKVQRDAYVTNLGNVEEEYDGHIDEKKKERKETIFEIKNESQIESDSKTIIYSDSFNDDELNKGKKTKSNKTKTEKNKSKNEEKAKEEKEKEIINNKSKSEKNNQNNKEEKTKNKNSKSGSEKEKKESNNKSKNKKSSQNHKENISVIKEESKESKESEESEDEENSEELEESEESDDSKEEKK